jgi:5-methylcytosine-specific restriction protein A
MPYAPPHPCSHPGCGALAQAHYCPDHARERQQRYDRERGSASVRGYDSRWRRAREEWLRSHPLCAEHVRQGEVVAAVVVDHIRPHKGDRALFWDRGNWQSLCKACHDRKTALEDGRWGPATGQRRQG